MSNDKPDQSRVYLYMLFNFVTATGIVFANKIVFKTYGFRYATLMTALHFVTTTIGGRICGMFGFYTPQRLNHMDILPITISFASFVAFNNLSLEYNTVGFYQLMKVLTTPVVVVLQLFFFGVELENKLKLALVPVCIGVGMATGADFSFNRTGLFWAIMGLMATAFYQLLVKSRQSKLGVSAFQLGHYQWPQAATLVFAATPMFDTVVGPEGFAEFQFTTESVMWISISCILAFCVNLSTFLVIGATNPVTYQVLGHAKLCLILTSGLLFFGEDSNPIRLCGMALAFSGIVAYSHLRMQATEVEKNGWDAKTTSATGSSATDLKSNSVP